MKTTFTILGVKNGVTFLQAVGKEWVAMAENPYLGKAGEQVMLADHQYVSEGELSAFQRLWDIYEPPVGEGGE